MAARDEDAFQTILRHHGELTDGVNSRVAALNGMVTARQPWQTSVADLVAYLADEVLTHAVAEEQSLYPAAAAVGLAERVEAMVAEHRQLEHALEALARSIHGPDAARQAEALASLFATHVAAENDLILPALLEAEEASLADLLGTIAERYAGAKRGAIGGDEHPLAVSGRLTSALAEALIALAEAGRHEEASRLAAKIWVELHAEHPDIGVQLTALLHRLVDLEVPADRVEAAAPGDVDGPELDVRELPPARRHEAIFSAYHRLPLGASFVLVNDHDPKPLRYQMAAENPGQFSWEYLQSGPSAWKVRIGRAHVAAADSA